MNTFAFPSSRIDFIQNSPSEDIARLISEASNDSIDGGSIIEGQRSERCPSTVFTPLKSGGAGMTLKADDVSNIIPLCEFGLQQESYCGATPLSDLCLQQRQLVKVVPVKKKKGIA